MPNRKRRNSVLGESKTLEQHSFTASFVESHVRRARLEQLRALRDKLDRCSGPTSTRLDFREAQRQDYRAAGLILNGLRKRGKTIPTPHALIAALALRHDLTLLERDGHFEDIAVERVILA